MRPDISVTHDEPPNTSDSISPYLLWVIWLMWLPFLIQPVIAIVQMPPSFQRVASICGLALFVATYLWATWHEAYRLTRMPLDAPNEPRWWIPAALLALLSTILPFVQGAWGLGGYIFTSASVAGRLTARQTAFVIGGLMLLVVIVGGISTVPPGTIAEMLFLVLVVGVAVSYFSWAMRTNRELRLARREIARLAVSEERLRFARDLHDLLGHTLSLITLKSELAGQLIPEDPEQAQREVREVEAAARTALQEVREAVAGYRQSTLANELQRAHELLAAAGIQCIVQDEAGTLSPASEALLTWVVREGVTNVIRHSRAKHCIVSLTRQDGSVRMTITDDGRGAPGQNGSGGNGLRGIGERVAVLDGQYEAVSLDGRGFRLAVTLPVQPTQAKSDKRTVERHPEEATGAIS